MGCTYSLHVYTYVDLDPTLQRQERLASPHLCRAAENTSCTTSTRQMHLLAHAHTPNLSSLAVIFSEFKTPHPPRGTRQRGVKTGQKRLPCYMYINIAANGSIRNLTCYRFRRGRDTLTPPNNVGVRRGRPRPSGSTLVNVKDPRLVNNKDT